MNNQTDDQLLAAAVRKNDEAEQIRKDKSELLKLRGEAGGFGKRKRPRLFQSRPFLFQKDD